MVLNPHIQRKAQAELDAIIGGDRLPTMEDVGDFEFDDVEDGKNTGKTRTRLRYLRAIVLECLR